VQLSAASQAPLMPRQTVPAVVNPSTGHSGEAPVQLSATSHAPDYTAALESPRR
jgi:hypothetical protein